MCVMQQEEKNAQLPRGTVHRSRCCGKQQGFSNCEGCCVHARTSNFFFSLVEKGASNCYRVGMLTSYVQSSNRSLHCAGPKTRKQQK